jgi:phosphoglycolate phosphatase
MAIRRNSAVLFDLDGCIVDSLPSIIRCWNETLPEFGLAVPPEEVIRAHVGPPVTEAGRAFAPGRDEAAVAELVAAYRALSAQAQDIPLFPGMDELISSLEASGWRLGIATSKSQEVAEPLLEHLGLTRRFAVIEATRVNEPGTDKATIVGRALARLAPQVPVAHVGDRRHDVEGAHAQGLTAVGVLWGYGSEVELTGAGADVLVSTPDDLRRWLETADAGSATPQL